MHKQIQSNANPFYNVTKNYKVLQQSSSLELLLNSIQKNFPRPYYTYKVVYDDNKIPLQYHHFNYIPSQKDLEIYQWRNEAQSSIVKIQHVAFQSAKEGSKFSKGSIVFTDHVIKTFRQLKNIPLSGVFYLLKQTLKAFSQIKQRLGILIIKKEYCGIDVVGRCKVWINSNFSKNDIEKTIKSQYNVDSEKDIVLKTIDIFKTMYNMENQMSKTFFNLFQDFSQNQKLLCIKSTIKFIDDFALKNKITISNFISPLLFEIDFEKKKSSKEFKANQVKKEKNCHIPQFLQKNNRRDSLAGSLCHQNSKTHKSPTIINHNYNINNLNSEKLNSNKITQLFRTPIKDQSDQLNIVDKNKEKEQRKNIKQDNFKENIKLKNFDKSFKQIKQKDMQQKNRRASFIPLNYFKKQSNYQKKSQDNKSNNQNIREVLSTQKKNKDYSNYLKPFKNINFQQNNLTPFKSQNNDQLNLQINQESIILNSVKDHNLMSHDSNLLRKRNVYSPCADYDRQVRSTRKLSQIKKRKISDISACQNDNDIQISDFHTKRQNIQRNEISFKDKNESDNDRVNIEGVQLLDELDDSSLICRQQVSLKKQQQSFQSFCNKQKKSKNNNLQLNSQNTISNQYNIAVNFDNNDYQKCKQKSENSKSFNKQSMTSTAQYTSFNSANKKSPLNSLNWISTSNPSIQNDLSDFNVRMADSYVLNQNFQKQTQKRGTISNITQNHFIDKNTRSQKNLNILKPSFAQSVIKNDQQQKFILLRRKTDNNLSHYISSFQSQQKKQNVYDKPNIYLPLSFQQIKNIATVQSGFIKVNEYQLNQNSRYNKEQNLQKSNDIKNNGANSKNSNNSGSNWLMNKKLQGLIQKNSNNGVSESICQGNDFGAKKKDSFKIGDLQILSKMGRQIDSTIFSQGQSI